MKILNLIINKKNFEFPVKGQEMLSTVIREKAGLTGTKIGCSQGNCGACTVLANGKPVLSCITPAIRMEGAQITTIEGISQNGNLHLLQKKFVEKGAIQCGFCTPGMILTTFSMINDQEFFLKKEPGKENIKNIIREGLSGNLCRCTGYKKIIDAAEEFVIENKFRSLKLEKESSPVPTINWRVRKGIPLIEAEKKVCGRADFADDIKIKDALCCKFLRSTYSHAMIEDIDISAAQSMHGVRYICRGKELPQKFGVLPISQDETAMAIEKTRYAGEIIAAIAADSYEIAQEACNRIKVKYKPLKEFFTLEDSVKDIGENEKIHHHTKFNNNIHKKAELRFGDQADGFRKADKFSEMEFEFEGVSHAFTEPHAATAYWDENGLTIITATQVPHYLHRTLAKVLEIPLSRVRVIKPYVGGGFGGKSDPFPHEIIISHIARKTGKPVRVCFSREEVFITNHGRHPSKIKMKLGASSEGIFNVLDADIIIDGGAYGSFGVVTSYYNGVLLQAPYRINNFGFKTLRVYTNKPQCGAMRGHGAVNSRFAVECIIDDLAIKLKTDPCELRLKNFFPPNSVTVGQYRITSNGSRESLQKVMEQSGWKQKFGYLKHGHGIGVACGFFISGSAKQIIRNELPQTVVHLKIDFDGRVLVTSGASDIGQGSDTMLAIIVSEVLGIDSEKIFVLAADTLLTPVDLGSYSSRVTFMVGNAAKAAAEKLKKEILISVSKRKIVSEEELNISDSRVFTNDLSVNISWNEAIDIALTGRGSFSVHGNYISPDLGGDFKGSGAGLSPSYSFGAVVAEVKVDLETGQTKVLNLWGAHDCGKAINPLAVEGQLEGSWHMGLGQVMSEQMKFHNGLHLNNNFLDYKIPTSLDTPEINTNIIETIDPEGPFGAKECGEGALHPSMPAIANAIFNAVGIRVSKLPISPEEIILKAKKILETEKL